MSKGQRQKGQRRKEWGFARRMPVDESCEQAYQMENRLLPGCQGLSSSPDYIGHTTDTVSVSLFYNKLFPIEQILSMPAWYDFRQDFSNEGEKCHMKILYSTCYKLRMQNRFILFSMTTPDALQLQSLEYQANNGEKVKPCQGVSRERWQEGRFTFFLHNNFLKMWKTSVNVPWNLCERSKLSERFFSSYHYLHLFLSSI